MAIVNTFRGWPLAILLIAAVAGCAARSRKCERCDCGSGCALGNVACGVYHGTLADEVMCCNTGCLSQSDGLGACRQPGPTCGPDCRQCRECRLIPFGLARPLIDKPEPGPPPMRFRPEMPPKFLPVPTEPTVSPARAEAPEDDGGDIEVNYRKQLISPGRD
jgi:hypothetical protein